MRFEYICLVIMTILSLVAFLPSSIAKLQTYGLRWLASNRTRPPTQELSPWGGRAERAHQNLKDNFPAFAVAILLLGILSKFDDTTATASGIYVVGRLGHFFVYCMGYTRPRPLAFFVALFANIFLLMKALGA